MEEPDPSLTISLSDLFPILRRFVDKTRLPELFNSLLGMSNKIDPKAYMAGTWLILHHYAEEADTQPEKRKQYISFLRWLANIFWCPDCAEHFRKYITDNPPEKSYFMGVYMHKFHNAVNSRLGKPEFTPVEYDDMFKKKITPPCPGCAAPNQRPQHKGGVTFNMQNLFLN